ncbi:hypothetical protein HQ393_00255 [Chitinibacter bivalviorum]|uniref:Uncharacterized protein n=1 Tax=Chitinibacter bivalviorum TaxID=2739434 RepID=A0A7H9BF35_9NEIS|nr:hypothetical protein [Chitinibacter bivalviorum]QLG86798.1 hypothetical protein HQ393_00255 [Chitinibacter bivalviorum]
MYIILIGYLFVVIMMSLGAGSITVGVFYFLFLAVLPTWGLLALKRSIQRSKAAKAAELAEREATLTASEAVTESANERH